MLRRDEVNDELCGSRWVSGRRGGTCCPEEGGEGRGADDETRMEEGRGGRGKVRTLTSRHDKAS